MMTMRRLWMLLAGTALLAGTGCSTPGAASADADQALPPTRVILVRHAEKAGDEGDVPLTDAGRQRAALLADMLGESGVDAVYSTHWKRNTQTAAPLARAAGLDVTVLRADDAAAHARDLARRLRTAAYHEMYIATLAPDAPTQLVILHYGQKRP